MQVSGGEMEPEVKGRGTGGRRDGERRELARDIKSTHCQDKARCWEGGEVQEVRKREEGESLGYQRAHIARTRRDAGKGKR